MQCPFCGADKDRVVDSRGSDGGKAVRRRRECANCSRRFTTYERIEEAPRIMVIKKDGLRVPFNRRQILAGLQKACFKRPVSNDQLRRIVEATEEEIFREFEKEVPSTFIGDSVAKYLRAVDKVAYIRFASVYRHFADITDLKQEIDTLVDAGAEKDDGGQLSLLPEEKETVPGGKKRRRK